MCPKRRKFILLDNLSKIGKQQYHVIGNHDSDIFPRENVMKFFKMKNSYYTFKYGKVKFIVLDTCFIKTERGYEPYYKKNYDRTKDIYPIIPDYEFKWLEKQFNDNSDYYVLFSYHSFENNFARRGVSNREMVINLINKVNNTGKRVLLSVNGHDHGDSLEKIGETYYFGLNSMSYQWFGPKYEHYCYSNEIHEKYPFIKDLVLYKNGLYAIITICENGKINIEGIDGSYQNISPKELGVGDTWNGRSVLPKISSLMCE